MKTNYTTYRKTSNEKKYTGMEDPFTDEDASTKDYKIFTIDCSLPKRKKHSWTLPELKINDKKDKDISQ